MHSRNLPPSPHICSSANNFPMDSRRFYVVEKLYASRQVECKRQFQFCLDDAIEMNDKLKWFDDQRAFEIIEFLLFALDTSFLFFSSQRGRRIEKEEEEEKKPSAGPATNNSIQYRQLAQREISLEIIIVLNDKSGTSLHAWLLLLLVDYLLTHCLRCYNTYTSAATQNPTIL